MTRSWLVERLPRLVALWMASRPSQLLLIGNLYVLGIGIATVGQPFVADGDTAETVAGLTTPGFPTRAGAGAVALLPVAVAVHYANEYADAETDALTDRTPFSGGSGALVTTGLPRSLLRTATASTCLVAVVVAAVGFSTGVLSRDAVALLAGILVAGLAYSLPPVALVGRGVGELVNMALGGLFLPMYGVAVVARPTGVAALSAVPFTLVVGCNLLAVHWPDREADETVGKRTLAVRLPPGWIRGVYLVLCVLATVGTAGLWWDALLPDTVALAHLVAVPFLAWGWTTLTRQRSPLPAVAAMVSLAVATNVAWWWVGLA
jgi:1,4-dihydroxy-2-naphthoate octaprenyltransferase